jgi:predicted Zn-dependent protease
VNTYSEQDAKELAQSLSEVKTGDYVACPLNDTDWIITRFYSHYSPYRQYVYSNGALRYPTA